MLALPSQQTAEHVNVQEDPTKLSPRQASLISDEVIADVAMGTLAFEDIAAQHLLPLETLERALSNPQIMRRVELAKQDLAKNGQLIRTRSLNVISEVGIPRCQQELMNSENTPEGVAKIMTVLAKLAGMDAKDASTDDKNKSSAPQINIIFRSAAPSRDTVTIEATDGD